MQLVILVFAGILTLILGAYWFFVVRIDNSADAELRKRLRPDPVAAIPKNLRLLKPAEKLSNMPHLNTLLGSMGKLTAPLQRDLIQAGMTTTVGTVLLAAGFFGALGYFVTNLLTGSMIAGVCIGVLLAWTPFIVVKRKKAMRIRKFEEQFPEAIDLIGRALRAGHAFTTGLVMVAEEIPAPVGEEFKLLYDRQNFGMPLPEAMRAFAARIPLLDARFFVTAVLTQRETGGNLGEVLDNLANVIRERFKVKRQVRVLTAHGRITGWVLAGLPPALAGAMMLVSPGHMKILTNDPLGVQMIIVGLTLQVIGTLVIRKLVDIRY
jgi:tight adherence protein B